ncbi:MAG: glutamine synthetase family protein [Lachnospiraceae bacterium]|nr:glutamine synthetase [Lachnospiraceae bacterium]MCR5767784.1 glutamine synthetase family protein [Lachnospiraceae bacterium]
MNYTESEVIQFANEEDVKFIRLAFCDVFGKQKNISIMPSELPRAFSDGISFDASAISGFGGAVRSDLFLRPDPSTLAVLPWRPEHGRVIRMYCDIINPDGSVFENDTRAILKRAVEDASKHGYSFDIGSEIEFYLFKLDANGDPTGIPFDNAGYMDIAPEDKGENVRREICLTLEQMGIRPESSHHEAGPGQNEIDFRYSDALSAADNAITFYNVVNVVAARNGLRVDFGPKPIKSRAGSGMHINFSIKTKEKKETVMSYVIAGLLDKIKEITIFLNPSEQSFARLGAYKAPGFITWSVENRSQLIRMPAANGDFKRAELRSPDPTTNPYLAYTMLIYAGLYGIKKKLALPAPTDINLFTADAETLASYRRLPTRRSEAVQSCLDSTFVKEHLPESIIQAYCR